MRGSARRAGRAIAAVMRVALCLALMLGCAARRPSAPQGPEGKWLETLKERIGKLWVPAVPDATSKNDPQGCRYSWKDRRTVVTFHLHRDGAISDVVVQKGSGVEYLDKLAIDTMLAVRPLTPPPEGLFKQGADFVELPFAFTLLKATAPATCG